MPTPPDEPETITMRDLFRLMTEMRQDIGELKVGQGELLAGQAKINEMLALTRTLLEHGVPPH